MSRIRCFLGSALVGFTFFGLIAWGVEAEGRVVTFDHWCAVSLQTHAEAHFPLLIFFRVITHLGGPLGLCLFTSASVVLLLRLKRRRLAVLWISAAISGALLNVTLKEIFDRPRPEPALRDTAVIETNESFPSGHSMGATVAFSMAAYVGWQMGSGRRWPLLAGSLAILTLLVGLSRMYLRAHYCSDVVGAFAVGGAWVCLWLALDHWLLAARQRMG